MAGSFIVTADMLLGYLEIMCFKLIINLHLWGITDVQSPDVPSGFDGLKRARTYLPY